MIAVRRFIDRLPRLSLAALCAVACVGAAEPVPADAPQAFHAPNATRAPLMAVAKAGARIVAVGDYGVIVLSDDGGETWRQARAVATRSLLTAVTFVDAQRGFAVGHGGAILRTGDGGETWVRAAVLEADATLLAVWFEDARHGIALGAFGLALETRDGGDHWKELRVGEGDDRDRHLNGIIALADGTLFIAAEAGTLFRSTDHGRTWAKEAVPYSGSLWGGLALRGGGALVFGMRGHVLLRARDGGWTDVPTGTDRSITGGVERADGTLVLVGLSGVVLQSRDGGRSYEASVRPERQTVTGVAEGAPGKLVLVGMPGVVKDVAQAK